MTACAQHTQAVQEREKLRAKQLRDGHTTSSISTSGSHHHDNTSTGGPSATVRSSSSTKVVQGLSLESLHEGGVSAPPPPNGKKSENPPLEVDIEAVQELIQKMKMGVGKVSDLGVPVCIVCSRTTLYIRTSTDCVGCTYVLVCRFRMQGHRRL